MSEFSPAHSAQLDTGSEQIYQNVTANRPKKRNRAAIACSSCRRRKMKCSHIIPEQTADEMLRGMPKSAQAYIRSLERRVRIFEDKEQSVLSVPEQTDLSSTNQTPKPVRDARASLLSVSRPPSSGPDSYRHVPQTVITESPEIFMGGKASESFTQLILNAMNHGSAKMETHSYSSPKESPRDRRDGPDLLDPPPDARDLIKVYLDFHHVVTPIFHVPTILAQFEQVLTCDPSRRHEHLYTIALLNMVCAIVVIHNRLGQGHPETVGPIARSYYDTAMLLVRPTIFEGWTIEKVQILILGSSYLQASSYPEECWNTLGLAVRMAYGLELHRPPDPTRFDCIAQEVRKRVWAACYVLDQLLSMIYGRPAATSAKSFFTTLPEDLDDDCIQPSRLLYPSVRSDSTSMSFSLAVSKLYRILETAASLNDNPALENILRLDEEFEAWLADLPPSLRTRNGVIVENEISLILALRANMVRILIHRQSLASALNSVSSGHTPTLASSREEPNRKGGRLRLSMMQQSRQICVATAEEVIQLVGQRHEQTKDAMGPSWFNLYYLFNAILIIFSHIVDPQYVEDRNALLHLDQAVNMIRQMSANHLCAQRAFSFLQQLLVLLDKTKPQDRQRHARYHSASVDIDVVGGTRPEYPAVFIGDGAEPIPDYTVQADALDLWSFWDSTQDLTTELESQLNLHSTLGSATWSWGG